MMNKKRHLRKSIAIVIEAIVSVAVAMAFFYVLFQAVMQQSYVNCPPTTSEVKENPSLMRYLK